MNSASILNVIVTALDAGLIALIAYGAYLALGLGSLHRVASEDATHAHFDLQRLQLPD